MDPDPRSESSNHLRNLLLTSDPHWGKPVGGNRGTVTIDRVTFELARKIARIFRGIHGKKGHE